MKKNTLLVFFVLTLNLTNAQEVLPLWDTIPNAINDPTFIEQTTLDENSEPLRVSQISIPTLTAFLVPKEKASGAAVLICPGGGYRILAITKEGYNIAQWLNSLGISAFVLKNRLPDDRIMENKTIGPLQDAQEGLRTIRRNAVKWNIDPEKIGVLGFSAGGHLAASLSTHYNQKVYMPTDTSSARPDFSILIYPVISMQQEITHMGSRDNLLGKNPSQDQIDWYSNEKQVNKNTPPAFLVHSFDDNAVPIENSWEYAEQLKANNVSVEMHAYRSGGHGYGLGVGDTHLGWSAACAQWLDQMGMVKETTVNVITELNSTPELCQGAYWTPEEAKEKMKRFAQLWTNQKEWEERTQQIKKQLVEGMQLSKIPSITKTQNIMISAPLVQNGYQVQNITLETFPGFYVTGNLYTPTKRKSKIPAILSPHGHGVEGRFSADVQTRCAMLAKMGAIVFSYDMVGYGESTTLNHKMPISLLLQTWNSKSIVDYLVQRDDVDSKRIGITGASGGGTQSFILAALDDRISVSVPVVQVSAHFFGGCACESGMPIHKQGNFQTNNVEIAASFAPKPQLIISDGADWTSNTPEVEFPYLSKVYSLYSKEDLIKNVHLKNEKHDYGVSKRIAAYDFLAKHLNLKKDKVQKKGEYNETDILILPTEKLKVYSTIERPKNELIGDESILTYLSIQK